MIVLIGFEVIFVICCVMGLCADHLLQNIMLWATTHWKLIELLCVSPFLLVVISEMYPVVKKEKRIFVGWFAFWNLARSLAASAYVLFLASDMVMNYSTMGFGEKIMAAFGMQIAMIPLLAYLLFEASITYFGGVNWKSVALGGMLSIAGIGLGAVMILF